MNHVFFERTPIPGGSSACLLGIALLATVIVPGGPLQAAEPHHTVVAAGDIRWGPAPPSLPPGAQAAMLLGSPAKEGPFAFRLKFPPGFVIPPHRHSKDELVTVIAGTFGVGTGEKLDRASVQPLAAQSFVQLPAGMPHYAVTEGETIVQVNGMGPFDVVYIDPKDDPRKQ
jgi:quercetin dioxygenase-like cupin family protein